MSRSRLASGFRRPMSSTPEIGADERAASSPQPSPPEEEREKNRSLPRLRAEMREPHSEKSLR
jgi:hypothetical protein